MTLSSAVKRTLSTCVLVFVACAAAAQQTYPSKPIRFITPYAPGGTTTIITRLFGQKLAESWDQQVVVDNRPGGNTIIGTEILLRSPPDGYTIMLAGGGEHVLTYLLRKAPYDPIKDFAPIATITRGEFVLLLNPSVPGNTLKEFIAYAKSRPGQLNYATSGSGGTQHLAHELLNLLAGIKTQHIPYKGGGPATADLIGGQVQVRFSSAPPEIPHIKSGKLKALAVTGEKRLAALPEVPTFIEAGLPGLSKAGNFQCILAPAGTPKPIVNKLSAELAKQLARPDLRQKLIGIGLEPFYSTPEKLAALLKEGLATYAKIIKEANITLEN